MGACRINNTFYSIVSPFFLFCLPFQQDVLWMAKQYRMDVKWHWAKTHAWNVRVRIDVWRVWKKHVRYYSARWPSKFSCRASVAPNVVKSVRLNHFLGDVFWARGFMMMANDTIQTNARHVPVWMVHRFVDAKRVPYSNVHPHIKNLHPVNVVRIAEICQSLKPVRPVHTKGKPIK